MTLATARQLARVKSWVYVLACEGDRFYVGFTRRLHHRLADHFARVGAIWTRTYRPLRVVALYEATSEEDEYRLWCGFADTFGSKRVGGWNKALCDKFNFEWSYPISRTSRKYHPMVDNLFKGKITQTSSLMI